MPKDDHINSRHSESSNESLLSAAEVQSAKKINQQLKELGLKKYPEEFLGYLKEAEPNKFDEFMSMEQELETETPEDTLNILDSALSEWEFQEAYNAEAYRSENTSDSSEQDVDNASEKDEKKEEIEERKSQAEYLKKRIDAFKISDEQFKGIMKSIISGGGLHDRAFYETMDSSSDVRHAEAILDISGGSQEKLKKAMDEAAITGKYKSESGRVYTYNDLIDGDWVANAHADFVVLAVPRHLIDKEKQDASKEAVIKRLEKMDLNKEDWEFMLRDIQEKGLRDTSMVGSNNQKTIDESPTPTKFIGYLKEKFQKGSSDEDTQTLRAIFINEALNQYYPNGNPRLKRYVEDATPIESDESSAETTAEDLQKLIQDIRENIKKLPKVEDRERFRKRTNKAIEDFNAARKIDDKIAAKKAERELYQIAKDLEAALMPKDEETPADTERSSSRSDSGSSSSSSTEGGSVEAGEKSDDETEHSAKTDAGTVAAPAGDSARASVDAGTTQAPEGEEVREAHESHEKALATLNQLARFGFNVKPGSRRNFTERIEMNIKKKYKREYGDHVQVSLKDVKVENGEARVVLTIRGEQNEPTAKFEEMILKGFANTKLDKTSNGRVDVGNGMQVEDSKANRDAVKKLFKKSMFNNIFELKVLDQTDVAKADTEAGVEHGGEVARLAEYVQETYLDADTENKRAYKRAAKYAGFKNKRDAEKSLKANWEKLKASGLLTDDEVSKVDSQRKK